MRFHLNLREKVILPVLLTALVLTTLILIITRGIASSDFLTAEKTNALDDLQQINRTLYTYFDNLRIKISDWAIWDDSYNFILHPNPQFIESNLGPSATSVLEINFIAYLDHSGKIIYIAYNDSASTPPADLIRFLTTYPKFNHISSSTDHSEGLIPLSQGPMAIASRAVTKSDGTGNLPGTIVFGRFLDDQLLRKFSQTTAVPFTVTAISHPPSQPTNSISVVNPSYLNGVTSFPDINGVNLFQIQAQFPRTIYSLSQHFLKNTTLAIGSGMAFMGLFIALILTLVAVKPIMALSGQIGRLINTDNFSDRISGIRGNDEISRVAKNINKLLDQIQQGKISLEEKMSLSNKQNSDLINNRKAILNLLEDSRNLESDLKRERDQAQTIVSSLGEGVVVVDRNFRITLINKTAANLLDVTAQNALNSAWTDIVKAYNEDREVPLTERPFALVIQNKVPVITTPQSNLTYRTVSGHQFPFSAITTPLFTSDNQIIGAVQVFRDITAEKEATQIIEHQVKTRTQELQWEKARLTTSINSLPNGFILTDSENNILVMNHSASVILDLPEDTKSVSDIESKFSPSYDFHAALTDCLENPHTLNIPEIAFGKKYVRLFISPIYVKGAAGENYVGCAFLITDITEQKILERSKDEFFSIASHELRTPLTAIRGNTSLILEYYTAQISDPELRDLVNDIHESSVRLIAIVNDFLDVSRLEQSRIQFKKTSFDIAGLSQEVVKELQSTTPPPPVPLLVIPSENPLPPVFADRDRTKQILFNLLGNANKFTTTGHIDISFAVKDNFLEISVTDTGRGIPLAQQSLLFHKFQQAGENILARDTSKGTGLGLYISKLMAEGMGGKIYMLKSEPDVGSVFIFTLPLSTPTT